MTGPPGKAAKHIAQQAIALGYVPKIQCKALKVQSKICNRLVDSFFPCKNHARTVQEGEIMTFSERAKPLKNKGNLTLKQIAEACNISESMASRYISGAVVPPEDVARKMLEILGAEEENTIEGEPDMRTALAMIKELYEARISDMWATIADLKDNLSRERKEKWVFFGLMAIAVAFVFVLFWIDITNGRIGWYRY